MRATFLVNPHAGKGRAPQLAHALADNLRSSGHEIAVIEKESLAEAQKSLIENLSVFPPERVVVFGGDGNVHWSVQSLVQSQCALEVIPTGTGNDFARTHNFAKRRAIDPSASKIAIDLGKISYAQGERYFGQILSTGFDSLVNKRANEMKFLRGRLKYSVATLLELREFKPIPYVITVDGKRRSIKAVLVAVGNGDSYGGGMKLIPMANPRDGKLDILILHAVSTFTLLRVFPRIFSGRHVKHPAVEILSGKRIIIDSKALVYADGEYVTRGKITVEVLPAALNIVAKP